MNVKCNKHKKQWNIKKQRDEEQTNAALPIHDNVILVHEEENDGKELVALFTSTSPRHPIFPHRWILLIGEVVEPIISLEIVTHVLEVWGMDIQNKFITHEDLHKKLRVCMKCAWES